MGSDVSTRGSGYRYDDTFVALLRFSGGALGKCLTTLGPRRTKFHSLNVYGTKKTFVNDMPDAKLFSGDRPADEELLSNEDERWRYPGMEKGDMIPDFIAAIREGREPEVGARDVFRVMDVCFAAGGSLDGDANNLKYNNTLKGGDLTPWAEEGIRPRDLYWYTYPSDEEIDRAGLRMIYLGYYIPDFYDFVNGRVALEHGLTPRHGIDARPEENGHITPFDALDDDFVMVNQLLKHLKFGFGKVTEQVSGAIRSGFLTRERGLELVRLYDGRCSARFIRRFCDYIEIGEDEFWRVAESYRNPEIWERDRRGRWVPRFAVYYDTPDHRRPPGHETDIVHPQPPGGAC